jgi:probable F420-dependent oxidoreductase
MSTRRAWLDGARKAETLGYSTSLIRDHFVPDFFGDQFAPFAALMAAANATTTLRVGSLVIDNDFRHPVVLAKEAATIDVLSDGRFELGLGAGWLQTEYDKIGMPFDPAGIRIERMEEAIHIVKGLFSDRPVTYSGRHYAIAELDGFPKPLQRPHPPLLIGGGGKRILRLAGREADIVHILPQAITATSHGVDPAERLPDRVLEKISWVREGAGDRFDEIEIGLGPKIVVADNRRAATECLIGQEGWSGLTVEQVWQMPSVFVGSVEQIVADMEERRERFGFSYIVVTDAEIERCAPIVARLAGR